MPMACGDHESRGANSVFSGVGLSCTDRNGDSHYLNIRVPSETPFGNLAGFLKREADRLLQEQGKQLRSFIIADVY